MDGLDFFNTYIVGSIEILISFHFYIRFLGKKIGFMKEIALVMIGIAVTGIMNVSGIFQFIVYILLFIAGGIAICKTCNILIALYAIVTIESINLCYGILNSLSSILFPIFSSENLEVIGFIMMIAGNILALLASILCYRSIYRCFVKDEEMKTEYALMILIPTLLLFMVSEYIGSSIYGNTITVEGGMLSGINPVPILLVQLLGIASLFCIMYCYRKIMESFRLSRELSLLEQEKHFLNQYVEEAKMRYEKTKAFRHDVKNHMSIVKELVQKGNTDAALEYMEGIKNLAVDMSFPVSTNNPVLDILMGNKLGIAKSNHIKVDCSFIVPYPCKVTDVDFCIIFSNALDNAITACSQVSGEKQKYIYITGKVQGDFILIEIENSYDGEENIQSGTGIANIKTVAEKYHGAMEIKTEDKKFCLSVLLIIPHHSEDISQQVG
ncbi:MAG: GHKL domain-containing protein [Lachnospiraceae bacterium]|nr:GHKL domain-containing protein [Lachnospiraceae bacterium]